MIADDLSEEEIKRLEKMYVVENHLKRKGYDKIVGIDEAGRGPLAGPVVAAACMVPDRLMIPNLNDSKQLDEIVRLSIYEKLISHPNVIYSVGIVDAHIIDEINILQATFLAMQKAVESLPILSDYLLIDGKQMPCFDTPILGIVKGDSISISIAASSIIAKCVRDKIMQNNHLAWSEFGFDQHKGYGTKQHIAALKKYGPCEIHRKSFEPVRLLVEKNHAIT